jgi:hypothetical protein
MEYVLHVIEWQHRGLPHAHIVFKVKNAPTTEDDKLAWAARHIQARFPDDLPSSASTEEKAIHTEYTRKITDYMLHKCIAGERGCKNMHGICSRGYMTRACSDCDVILETGFPEYARPHPADLKVVPHNRLILDDWGGHANVELCSSSYAVLYLYKYLYKGNKKITIHLNNTDDLHPDDEINHHIRGRMLCSMEVAWRTLGFQMYPASTPTVVRIKVQLQEQMTHILSNQKLTDLAVYFNRPQNDTFKDMKYTEFFKAWMYAATPPKSFVLAGTPGNYLFLFFYFLNFFI